MESILNSVKKILGLAEDYTAYDVDVIIHINATFSVLNDLGVGPDGGFFIEDAVPVWTDLGLPPDQLHMAKTYVYLKVRMLFDPPATSFHIKAMEEQVRELEWRLNMKREYGLDPELPETIILSGGGP